MRSKNSNNQSLCTFKTILSATYLQFCNNQIIMCIRKNKTQWSEQEDNYLRQYIEKNGNKDWRKIQKKMFEIFGDRKKTAKKCKQRYRCTKQRYENQLDPRLVREQWTQEQEQIMFEEHRKLGNRWTLISQKLPGRTSHSIKNHFYSLIRKNFRRFNKFLGSKDSTLLVKKIKPSSLSKFFSFYDRIQMKQRQKEPILNEVSLDKYKQFINNLKYFSKLNLEDTRFKLREEDMMIFSKIIQQLNKNNKNYQQGKQTSEILKKSQLQDPNDPSYEQSRYFKKKLRVNESKTTNKGVILVNVQVDRKIKRKRLSKVPQLEKAMFYQKQKNQSQEEYYLNQFICSSYETNFLQHSRICQTYVNHNYSNQQVSMIKKSTEHAELQQHSIAIPDNYCVENQIIVENDHIILSQYKQSIELNVAGLQFIKIIDETKLKRNNFPLIIDQQIEQSFENPIVEHNYSVKIQQQIQDEKNNQIFNFQPLKLEIQEVNSIIYDCLI